MASIGKIARRTFLIGSAAIAGGVAIGYWQYKAPYPNPLKDDLAEGETALTPYVLVDATGITIIAPRAEMGQGVSTTLAALVAEELDVAWDDIRVIHGPASKAYFNSAGLAEGVPIAATDQGAFAEGVRGFVDVPAKFMGMQMTGGSSSTPDAFVKMRKAGAAARIVLIKAAAKRLGVSTQSLSTQNGAVIAPDGSKLLYTELATLAAEMRAPGNPALKPKSDWQLLGKSLPRVDMVSKCTGTAQYSLDVRLPGMLYATVKMNPHLEAGLTSFDASRAETMRGVKSIVPLDNGIAVIATNTWYALRAAEAIDFEWQSADYPSTTDSMFERISETFTKDFKDSRFRDDGDVDGALGSAESVIEAEYRAPYLAHATMEPPNTVALLKDGRLDIWTGNQIPTQVRTEGEIITGLKADAIRVHTTVMGGGFGRRLEMDYVRHAIKLAKSVEGTPIKVTWSREEDMTHAPYRPMAMARFRGAVKDGRPVALDLHLSASSIAESQFGRIGVSVPGPDFTIVQSAWDQPYGVENYRVTGYRAPMMLPVSSWRSVGGSQNGFFHECALDELSHAAGADPLAMRLELMTHEPSRKVLEAVADMSGWGSPLPAGGGRGVAYSLSFGVPTAEVVEVEMTNDGLKIVKVFAAADVGIALDPRIVEAQIQGAIVFGLSAAVSGAITVKDGKVEQSNFHDYEPLRLYQSPNIAVRILENGPKIRGIGEPGTPPAAPALANAIFAATGQRIRELPLNKHIKFI